MSTLTSNLINELALGATKASYTCVGCRIRFETIELQREHFKTAWHLYNLKRKVCKLEPIDLNSFVSIQEAAAVLDSKTKGDKKSNAKTAAKQNVNKSSNDNNNTATTKHDERLIHSIKEEESKSGDDELNDDDSNWEEVDDDQLVDEDYDDSEVEAMLAQVVKDTTCLFCGKNSPTIESNLSHMNALHGFFIPEEQYLIDLEGMMEYLGFKVGAGATCLWCNKQFTTLHGARLHMLYKDHCRIYFDQDKATEEFKDFYDYSSQIQIPMKPLSELAIPKRRSEKFLEHQRALMLKQKSSSKQLIARQNPTIVAGTFQSKDIKKFNSQRAKKLLRIGMTHNNAMRGRLRQQNPM